MIPQAHPRAQYLSHQAEIDCAIARVLHGGRYVLGDEVAAFETEFASVVGCRFGIGVGSGTDALHLALRACGVGRGDEVITTSHTAVATISAIDQCGATPVLVDIEPEHYTLDPAQVEMAISPRTKAVIPVHLYGQPADLPRICAIARDAGLSVIEDCAQAHGAELGDRPVGSWGDIACFSFYPTKNLGAIGDGGLVTTSDPARAERVRRLREYGWRTRYVSEEPGGNSRLDELQAAILRVKLKYLAADNLRRATLAGQYDLGLAASAVGVPACRPGARHVYHVYVVRSLIRDRLRAFLDHNGVGTAVHYPVPVHLQPAYCGRLGREGTFPETERAAREILSLPMYPELTEAQVATVSDAIGRFDA